jgi:hypothetical protein
MRVPLCPSTPSTTAERRMGRKQKAPARWDTLHYTIPQLVGMVACEGKVCARGKGGIC